MEQVQAKDLLKGIAEVSQPPFITAVVTDSRAVIPGSIFVAIKGERVDGHDYAQTALEKGAAFIVAERLLEHVPADKLIVVPNSQDAMIKIGGNYRDAYSPILVGVTGSVGKTTTKEFVACVLAAFGKTLKTEGNQNNELGVPNTLMRLDDTYAFAVVEMGMDNLGDIHKLTSAVKPQAAIITCIGVSHIQNLKTQDNILKAKMEICDGMEPGGLLVLNGDDAYLKKAVVPPHLNKVTYGIENPDATIYAKRKATDEGEHFTIVDREYGNFDAYIPAVGPHNIYNALGAYTLATRLGLSPYIAVSALEKYTPAGMRQKLVKHKGITVLEDCYNANPDSMRAAVNAVTALKAKKTIAVFGDMLELGEISTQSHMQVGAYAAQKGVDVLITYGEQAQYIYEGACKAGHKRAYHTTTKQEAAQLIAQNATEGDAVIVKASRGMKFEEILQAYYEL
ncbi:MAG: UDP-N-acetylmuramoyl-tripeptide--D-alanyl-D-alanine ligase [Oscillospiraceae bacterium]|nr:UDP-N-acetylmuramoyl-tripeptide--D-alanyl-D-alanine ligase [Oscillospiraceae bacterium]